METEIICRILGKNALAIDVVLKLFYEYQKKAQTVFKTITLNNERMKNLLWYEDEAINFKSEECDDAFDSGDGKLLLKLSEECRLLAENKNLHKMIKAKYYYDGFTCLSNYLEIEKTSSKKREEIIEKILYLCRTGLILLEEYCNGKSMDKLEKAQYNGIYYPTVVNYCNILSHIGRLPKAMHTIRPIAAQGFGMAIGNLAMELYDYSKFDYDTGHQQVLLEKVCVLLKEAISYPNIYVHEMAKKRFWELLLSILGNEAIEEKLEKLPDAKFLNINKFDTKYDSLELMDSKEQNYKKWVSSKCLSLNTLNDVDYSLDISYDPIHLPNMLTSLEEKYPRYHGLFNQIKQEYCSARYMIYDGIFNSKHHFSDAEVYLVNTLDYPVYSYNIEKVKSAYRTIYSLFDRIAFFLNEYFSLGIAKDRVSFGAVWRKNSRLHEIAASNYLLAALHWIKKDLYKNSVSEYKEYIDPILHRTYEIRNVMEHRYLKILDNSFHIDDKQDIDKLAFVITIEEFHELAINLLRTCREAIILLVMAINIEEKRKYEELGEKFIPSISLSSYEDEWKF